MSYELTPGGAILKGGGSVADGPAIVKVSAAVASRSQYLRLEFLEAADGPYAENDLICAMFRDPKTGEVYGQPIPDQEGVDGDDQDER